MGGNVLNILLLSEMTRNAVGPLLGSGGRQRAGTWLRWLQTGAHLSMGDHRNFWGVASLEAEIILENRGQIRMKYL
jgi:hypothetical protein